MGMQVSVFKPLRAAALILSAALIFTGCAPAEDETPTVTPELPEENVTETPTEPSGPPEVRDLVLSLSGLGPVEIDRAPVTEGDDAILQPGPVCTGEDISGNEFNYVIVEPIWGAEFPGVFPGQNVRPFGVGVDQDNLLVNRVDVFTPEIKTDEGIHIGSTINDVLAAYSNQIIFDEDWDVTRVTVVSDGNTQITFESAIDVDNYWQDASLIGTVLLMRLETIDAGSYSSWAQGRDAGYCPFDLPQESV